MPVPAGRGELLCNRCVAGGRCEDGAAVERADKLGRACRCSHGDQFRPVTAVPRDPDGTVAALPLDPVRHPVAIEEADRA